MPTAPTPFDTFTAQLRARNFKALFRDLGWDTPRPAPTFAIDTAKAGTFHFEAVAEKRGLLVLVCPRRPDAAVRRELDQKLEKRAAEHFLIFADPAEDRQLWQFVLRDLDKTRRVVARDYHHHQSPRLLWQQVSQLRFAFEEEDSVGLTDAVDRVRRAAGTNADAVTKKFYVGFSKQHKDFMARIEGLPPGADDDRRWYASLMLNRLMFLYFVQAQGYLLAHTNDLDGDRAYLRTKYDACQKLQGHNRFHSFYKSFLRRLFHEALNKPEPHDAALQALIGRVPYLNGGLFERHALEQRYDDALHIPDAAFEPLLTFLSQWTWHLDTRVEASGKEINPDVLGYIFERYINERAAMGAYYTKEDVTGYIARNCLVPALFDRMAQRGTPHESEVWNLLRDAPHHYLYPAQLHGYYRNPAERDPHQLDYLPLPAEIEKGIADVAARTPHWNRPTPPEYGLPTEIWRETIARRTRTQAALEQLHAGTVRDLNTLVTLNLNVRQFLHDAIYNAGNPEWVWQCFEALRSLTVLDPTCGSGAFLFAALGLLEPLYEACMDRMEAFLPELTNDKASQKKHEVVAKMLAVRHDLDQHHQSNRAYFITKTIILRNLFGVDLMHEAVEIAKLRLFLQLMATLGEPDLAAPNMGLEPLPDIDFNIRAGNTLVGIATEKELDGYARLDFGGEIAEIKKHAKTVAADYAEFQTEQTDPAGTATRLTAAKGRLRTGLDILKNLCDELLHRGRVGRVKDFVQSHQPFHWFAEFYDIIGQRGGFDVVIGNPPYVVYTAKNFTYKVKDYTTLSCANLFAFAYERSLQVMNKTGRIGFIIPNSSVSTDKMAPLQKLICEKSSAWVSSYSWRPATLFEGVNMRLSIILANRGGQSVVQSAKYARWNAVFRPFVFENVQYHDVTSIRKPASIPKLTLNLERGIFARLNAKTRTTVAMHFMPSGKHHFFYFRAVLYWIKILTKAPVLLEDGEQTTTGEMKTVYTRTKEQRDVLVALLSSSLYSMYYTVWSSCQVINSRDFDLPFDYEQLSAAHKEQLVKLAIELQKSYQANSEIVTREYAAKSRAYTMQKQYFYINQSKPILDEIDTVLAAHYGLTDEELDFILNYDIKYRMGAELDTDD